MAEIYDNWDTEKGLWLFTVFVFITTTTLAGLDAPKIGFLVYALIMLGSYYFTWRRRRSFGTLRKNINVVFAFYSATQTQSITDCINNLRAAIDDRLREYSLGDIRPKFLPLDCKINSAAEAEQLIQNGYAGHTLMVWGTLMDFKGVVNCRNTNFSYEFGYKKYKYKEEDVKKFFSLQIQHAVSSLGWDLNLSKKKQFDNYVGNINDVGMYTIGRTLLTVQEVEKSIEVFTKLLETTAKLNLQEYRKRGTLIAATKEVLSKIYLFKAVDCHLKKDNTGLVTNGTKSHQYGPNLYQTNLLMSYIYERILNDEPAAKGYLFKAKTLAKSKSEKGYLFSEAYFHLKHRDFPQALRIYDKLAQETGSFKYVAEVVEDLMRLYDERAEPQYLFAAGYIKNIWLPDDDGKSLLEQFLEDSSSLPANYTYLIEHAQKIVQAPSILGRNKTLFAK